MFNFEEDLISVLLKCLALEKMINDSSYNSVASSNGVEEEEEEEGDNINSLMPDDISHVIQLSSPKGEASFRCSKNTPLYVKSFWKMLKFQIVINARVKPRSLDALTVLITMILSIHGFQTPCFDDDNFLFDLKSGNNDVEDLKHRT